MKVLPCRAMSLQSRVQTPTSKQQFITRIPQ
jgi:hypothetical protein